MERTNKGEMFTQIVLATFKLSGMLAIEGDRLTQSQGISSARWKVLGALFYAETPQTVSQIARTMGQTRQSVQRLVDIMKQDGLLELLENPEHKRAKLVALTTEGKNTFNKMDEIQIPWANNKAENFDSEELEITLKTLMDLTNKF